MGEGVGRRHNSRTRRVREEVRGSEGKGGGWSSTITHFIVLESVVRDDVSFNCTLCVALDQIT